MNEKELIKIIKSTLNSAYIGDDCAYLKDLGIVVSQDSLVEDVHFKRDLITPYQLGYKSIMVNISDICASGAEPLYLTVSLSLPKDVDESFVAEFYKGAKAALNGAKIVGGDLTGSDKIYVSVTAIGSDKGRKISSRANAKVGYKVIVSGEHGNSALGLKLLLSMDCTPNPPCRHHLLDGNESEKFISAHLMPTAQPYFSHQIASQIKVDYAMMDTSDGLADALIQIAKASDVTLSIDSEKIPHDARVGMDLVLYGGEDYQLVAAVPQNFLQNITDYTIIGEVKSSGTGLEIDGKSYTDIDSKLFNHFKEQT